MEKGNKVEIRKQIGRVFATNTLYNTCVCREVVKQDFIANSRTGELNDKYGIGICKCGNVFLNKFNNKQ